MLVILAALCVCSDYSAVKIMADSTADNQTAGPVASNDVVICSSSVGEKSSESPCVPAQTTYSSEEASSIIAKLSNVELRDKLVEYGEDIGPIGPAMRRLFEKKLLRLMMGETFKTSADVGDSSTSSPSSRTSTSSANGSDAADSNLYFAVSVPAETHQTIPGVYIATRTLQSTHSSS